MTKSSRLAAHRALATSTLLPTSAETQELPGDDAGKPPKSKDDEEDEDMTTVTPVEQTDAYQAGYAAANARFNAVLASEHYTGREATARTMLGKSMSAEDIIDVLATMPMTLVAATSVPAPSTEANDGAALAAMQAAIAGNVNAEIAANGGTATAAPAAETADPAKGLESMRGAMAKANEFAGY